MVVVSEKKGQLTIFVIVAIIVVFGIIGYFVFIDVDVNEKGAISKISKAQSVKNDLVDCMNVISRDSLDLVGMQGGHYDKPYGNYEEYGSGIFLSYYKDGDGVYLPSIELIESELEMAFDSTVDYCFKSVSLNYPELKIYFSGYNTSVNIYNESVGFVTLFDMVIMEGNKTSLLEFNEERLFVSSLKAMYDVADYYVYMNSMYNDEIPADGLVDISEKKSVTIDITNYDEGVLMVSIFPVKDLSYPNMFNFLHSPIQRNLLGNESLAFEVDDLGDDVEDEGFYEFNKTDFDEGFI